MGALARARRLSAPPPPAAPFEPGGAAGGAAPRFATVARRADSPALDVTGLTAPV
ncbi:hypothetical protein GCM10027160_51470 [Streptomyces calidiresistens]